MNELSAEVFFAVRTIVMTSPSVEEFWLAYCRISGLDTTTPYQVWYFGNSSAMARELADLVVVGTKTATASLLETNDLDPEKAPVSDGYSVVTSFEGEPICIIQTAEIRHLPFNEVDAEFAYDEGEDDRTLASWRNGHHDYFTRESAELGFQFDESSIVCCERFRLLFPV
ncbi:MAG TPA: ASCH domain-containing protein [Pyrinomonadaceae bacterium]|nr:ASCH domain-containing protein [Pyrinomonadaceae bacterium]